MNSPISVLLVSEYALIRHGILAYLNDCAAIHPVIQEDSLSQAMLRLAGHDVDVVIVDLSLLKPSGLSTLQQLLKQSSGVKIIILSRSEKEPFITQCIENGALGCVSLKCTREELIEAIQTVCRDDKYLSHDVAYAYAISNLNKTDNPISSLTSREYQVFALLAKGKSISDVAAELFISPKTVHVYRANIFAKLKLSSVFELTLLALRYGVISIDVLES